MTAFLSPKVKTRLLQHLYAIATGYLRQAAHFIPLPEAHRSVLGELAAHLLPGQSRENLSYFANHIRSIRVCLNCQVADCYL
jgi:hypothetical protein